MKYQENRERKTPQAGLAALFRKQLSTLSKHHTDTNFVKSGSLSFTNTIPHPQVTHMDTHFVLKYVL